MTCVFDLLAYCVSYTFIGNNGIATRIDFWFVFNIIWESRDDSLISKIYIIQLGYNI